MVAPHHISPVVDVICLAFLDVHAKLRKSYVKRTRFLAPRAKSMQCDVCNRWFHYVYLKQERPNYGLMCCLETLR